MISDNKNAFVFKEVNHLWLCVNRHISKCLCDFLADYGFSIPYDIIYCLAVNEHYALKFRVYGGTITCYIKDLSTNLYL